MMARVEPGACKGRSKTAAKAIILSSETMFQGRYFFRRQQAGGLQMLLVALEASGILNPAQTSQCERFIRTGSQIALIEEGHSFRVGMMLEKGIDLCQDMVRGLH